MAKSMNEDGEEAKARLDGIGQQFEIEPMQHPDGVVQNTSEQEFLACETPERSLEGLLFVLG